MRGTCGPTIYFDLIFLSFLLFVKSDRFLIVSSPRLKQISSVRLSDFTVTSIIDTGLDDPQGVAVDMHHKKLYIADPLARKIFSYDITVSDQAGVSVAINRQGVAVDDCEPRWVAVDAVGNLFYSDETSASIRRVDAEHALKRGSRSRGRSVPIISSKEKPTALYEAQSYKQVSQPGGIAVDNFHVFWSNKSGGKASGSVVKGLETIKPSLDSGVAENAAAVQTLADNADKVYGVCLAGNKVFYTDSDSIVYGVKKNGGTVGQITDQLQKPRGCSYDGDGTIYVADKQASAIYSFPAGSISPHQLKKVADIEDAFGVAVIQGGAGSSGAASSNAGAGSSNAGGDISNNYNYAFLITALSIIFI
eukprot:GHVL01007291.1.p1 GENE.GHVL01007291.1~~GHVL01007291.1.p1  ORF type:complete len:363 (+),score=56.71 GHVL01007291.1:164-1252(+)